MDARRFPSRQDAESENPLESPSRELLLPRGKAAFFGYFLCGGKESNPAAQRSEASKACTNIVAAYAAPTKGKSSRLKPLLQNQKRAAESAPQASLA